MRKYYKAKHEDLVLGLECEVKTRTGRWVKWKSNTEFDYIDFVNLLFLAIHVNKKQVRIKYLDSEDIEECGWKKPLTNRMQYHLYSQYKDHDFYIDFNTDTMEMEISSLDGDIFFLGKIYNKSELKRIMKQVGIK